MSAREAILGRIRSANVPDLEPPAAYVAPDIGVKSIGEIAVRSGAASIPFDALSTVLPETRLYSLVPEAETSLDLRGLELDARALLTVHTTVCRAEFIVQENGAVWVTAPTEHHRAVLFTCEQLVILVDPQSIVPTMIEALARTAEQPGRPGYYIAGPSKTADIEQCLVVGAQGARSVTIVLAPLES